MPKHSGGQHLTRKFDPVLLRVVRVPKASYFSASDAQEWAKMLDPTASPYQCTECLQWHLGHLKTKVGQ